MSQKHHDADNFDGCMVDNNKVKEKLSEPVALYRLNNFPFEGVSNKTQHSHVQHNVFFKVQQ